MTRQMWKEFWTFFGAQALLYFLWSINFRAVAQANYFQLATSDAMIAVVNFFVMRKIVREGKENQLHTWAGYVFGSVVGGIIGVYISKILLGQ